MLALEARWLALAVLPAARTSMGFQFQSLASAAPPLVADLGLGYAEVGSLIGLYFLPGVALALPGGLLGRRFGDTRVVAFGLALMAVGGALAGLAEGYGTLAAARLLSGLGAVLLNVLMAKMVADWFAGNPPRQHPSGPPLAYALPGYGIQPHPAPRPTGFPGRTQRNSNVGSRANRP